MGWIDPDGLSTSQAELLQELRNLRPGDHWFCFVNGGFTMADAKALHDRGLIDTRMQMGMPTARLTQPRERTPEEQELIDADDAVYADECSANYKRRDAAIAAIRALPPPSPTEEGK